MQVELKEAALCIFSGWTILLSHERLIRMLENVSEKVKSDAEQLKNEWLYL